MGYTYLAVECGSAMTVAQVDKSPYLLIWGYGCHTAWGFPDLFQNDIPIRFQAIGSILYVLTQKQHFYKINCEKRTYDKVSEMDNVEVGENDDEYSQQIVHYFACGSDFILTLNAGNNLFSMGSNKYG